MNYSKLSRESLIHEIEQLNKEKEQIRLEAIGSKLGIHESLNDLSVPAFIVNSDYNIIWANRFSSNNFDDILSQKCYKVFFGLEDVCFGCPLQNCFSELSHEDFITTRFSEGLLKEIGIKLLPIVKNEQVTGVLEIQTENHKQQFTKRITSIVDAYEHLKKKHEDLLNFIQHYSKSLRVPLRSFIGYFQAYSSIEPDNKVQAEYLQMLETNSEMLYETLNRLMVYIETEKLAYNAKKITFSLKQAINEVLDQVLALDQINKHSSYSLQYTETLPEVVVGDAFGLKMTLAYLLEFAIHLSTNQLIEIRISEVLQTHSQLALKITILTKFDPNRTDKPFDYYRIRDNMAFDSLAEFSQVLGIELAREIVESNKGTLVLSSGIDNYVYMDINLQFDKINPKFEDNVDEVKRERPKILIIDNERLRLSLEIFKAYDFYFASNGEEAVAAYFRNEPDLTIMNVMITGSDGFKVFDEIESRRRKVKPIIAISNKLIDNEREFMRDYGFDEYYPKPLDEEKLLSIITSYI